MRRDTKKDPHCVNCARKLRPRYDVQCIDCGRSWYHHHGPGAAAGQPCTNTSSEICTPGSNSAGPKGKKVLMSFGRGGGFFCSGRCAEDFGRTMARAGYRLKAR